MSEDTNQDRATKVAQTLVQEIQEYENLYGEDVEREFNKVSLSSKVLGRTAKEDATKLYEMIFAEWVDDVGKIAMAHHATIQELEKALLDEVENLVGKATRQIETLYFGYSFSNLDAWLKMNVQVTHCLTGIPRIFHEKIFELIASVGIGSENVEAFKMLASVLDSVFETVMVDLTEVWTSLVNHTVLHMEKDVKSVSSRKNSSSSSEVRETLEELTIGMKSLSVQIETMSKRGVLAERRLEAEEETKTKWRRGQIRILVRKRRIGRWIRLSMWMILRKRKSKTTRRLDMNLQEIHYNR